MTDAEIREAYRQARAPYRAIEDRWPAMVAEPDMSDLDRRESDRPSDKEGISSLGGERWSELCAGLTARAHRIDA